MREIWRRLTGASGGDEAAAIGSAERLRSLQRLLRAAEAATNAEPGTTSGQLIERIVGDVKAAFGASHACVHFVQPDSLDDSTVGSGMLACPVAAGSPEAQVHLGPAEAAAMARASQLGRPLRIGEIRDDMLADLAVVGRFDDGLMIPVAYQGHAFAWVNVYVPGIGRFDAVDESLLHAIGGMLYGAIKKEAYIAAIQRIRATLESHFSPQVVDRLISSPENLASQKSERLDVTVLFSDIRGFTSLSEQIDQDEVASMISEHLETMAAIVFRYGGIVDKYIGDSVMAVFGSPFPQGDHPRRAVAAACEMVAAQRDLQARWGSRVPGPVAIGIGINTGVVIAGQVGVSRREFTHLGDTVNLASRLKDLAKPWQILVNQTTHQRVGDVVEAQPLGSLPVRGRQEPVQAFEVTAYTGPVSALVGSASA